MKSLIMFVAVIAGASAVATPSQKDHLRAVDEARDLVHEAYAKARDYCRTYPNARQEIAVTMDGERIEIRVQCEVVNDYFRSHP